MTTTPPPPSAPHHHIPTQVGFSANVSLPITALNPIHQKLLRG